MSELVFDQRSNSWLTQDQIITNFLVFRTLRISPSLLPENFVHTQYVGRNGWTIISNQIVLFECQFKCMNLVNEFKELNNSYRYDFKPTSIVKLEIEQTITQLSEI